MLFIAKGQHGCVKDRDFVVKTIKPRCHHMFGIQHLE